MHRANLKLRSLFQTQYPDDDILTFFNSNLSAFFKKPYQWGVNWYREEVDLFIFRSIKKPFNQKSESIPLHAVVSTVNHSETKRNFLVEIGCTYHTVNLEAVSVDLSALLVEINRRALGQRKSNQKTNVLRSEESEFILSLSKKLKDYPVDVLAQSSLRRIVIPSADERKELYNLKKQFNRQLRRDFSKFTDLDPIGDVLETTSIDAMIVTSDEAAVPLLGIEIDGSVHYPDLNESMDGKAIATKKQFKDKIKNRIFRESGIPLLRFQYYPSSVDIGRQYAQKVNRMNLLLTESCAKAVSAICLSSPYMKETCFSILNGYIEEKLSSPLSEDLLGISKKLSEAISEEKNKSPASSGSDYLFEPWREADDYEFYWESNRANYASLADYEMSVDPFLLFSKKCVLEPHAQNADYSQVTLILNPDRILEEIGVTIFEIVFPDKVGIKIISRSQEIKARVEDAVLEVLGRKLLEIARREFLTDDYLEIISARLRSHR